MSLARGLFCAASSVMHVPVLGLVAVVVCAILDSLLSVVLAPMMRTDSISPKKDELNYSFVYISHPRAVTGLSWRLTSKYMPR